MYTEKGAITVFLSLLIMIFLSLFCTMAESVRVQGARLQAAAAFDMGLFSLFAEYDKVLLEEYDLWFLDGTYGNETFSTDLLEAKMQDFLLPNLVPQEGLPLAGRSWNLFPMKLQECEMTGYALATDGGGEVFYRQVAENEKELLPATAVSTLTELIDGIAKQEEQGDDFQENALEAEQSMQEAQEAQRELEEQRAQEAAQQAQEGESEPEGELPAPSGVTVSNPLKTIEELQKKGVLALVAKDPLSISDTALGAADLPSVRALRKGTMTWEDDTAPALTEAAFLYYLTQNFSCATKEKEGRKMSYELEYIIAGKDNDTDNLKKVVKEILLLREGVNFACIYMNENMRSQTLLLAEMIAAPLGEIPILVPALQAALNAAWAYGESLLDLRTMLAGGKVPMVKTEMQWKLSLENLGNLPEILQECNEGGGEGLGYEAYLIGILALENREQRNLRALDLIEDARRSEEGGENFRADALVAKAEMSCSFLLAPVFLAVPQAFLGTANRGTQYHISGTYGYMEGGG